MIKHFAFLPSHTVSRKGFTLIELIAVIGIIGLISGVILGGYNKFGGQIILKTLVYDIALSLRQAQTYGISVKNTLSNSGFAAGYGVHFNSADPVEYILFADTYELVGGSVVESNSDGGDGVYTSQNEQVTVYSIGRGYKINQVCVNEPASEVCYGDGSSTGGDATVDILFNRPNPDAEIRINGNAAPYSRARIEFISPRLDVQSLVVEVSGQISIE
jgi:prepilin-type N-terminal cleavage/methylation domain-containing protein